MVIQRGHRMPSLSFSPWCLWTQQQVTHRNSQKIIFDVCSASKEKVQRDIGKKSIFSSNFSVKLLAYRI